MALSGKETMKNHKDNERKSGAAVRCSAWLGDTNFITLSDYVAWMRRGRENKQCPQSKSVVVIERPDGSLNVAESASHQQTTLSENKGLAILRVSVLYDKTRLKHPVKKWSEIIKIVYRLVFFGCHVVMCAMSPNDPSSATAATKRPD